MEIAPYNWERVKQLFEVALELEPSERQNFLAQNCDDEILRQQVEQLLLNYQQAGSFLDNPVVEPRIPGPDASPRNPKPESGGGTSGSGDLSATATSTEMEDPMVGRHLGAYKLIRRLGQGGMAAVYLAARADDEFRKQAAVKIVQPGLDSQNLVKRFRNERQTLAGLDHPNIVKLLDGGSTSEGLPFLVMDYVEGCPIDDYCDLHNLCVDDRLHVFSKVCEAVQYAHQKGVIHRDLKPGNIFVTADGTPKLLDFGIAKVLNAEPSSQMFQATQTGTRCMTPAYASPEQIRGKSVTAATDIYSLGVVLYELLSGHRPYRLIQPTPAEIERAICEQDPETPSTAVDRVETDASADGMQITKTPETVSKTREGPVENLRRRLRGDLDNIVLKALQKEPERRYGSVKDFLQDIERHLHHIPVIARRSTFAYRSSKFVQRHKIEVSAALLVILVLLAALSFTFDTLGLRDRFGLLVARYYLFRFGRASHEATAMTITPITASGNACSAAVSPDGKYVGYVLFDRGQYSIHLHLIAGGADIQIVPPSNDFYDDLQFSRNGNYLYYVRRGEFNGELYQVPILGGVSRMLLKGVDSRVAVSPEGNEIAFIRQKTTPEEDYVLVANADGSNEHPIALRKAPLHFGGGVAWAPDGKLLAVTGWDAGVLAATILFVSPKSGDSEHAISALGKWTYVGHLAWLPDGSGLIADAIDLHNTQHPLWLMKYPSGEFRRITSDLSLYNEVSLTADGRTMVVMRYVSSDRLWVAPNGEARRARPLTSQTSLLGQIAWTPEDRIAYSSGAAVMGRDVWVQDPDTGQAQKITEGGHAKGVEVSPDGSTIVFESDIASDTTTVRWNLWRMDSQGRNLKQLTRGIRDVNPKISPDGKWVIYSSSPRSREQHPLWKVPIDDGEPVELTQHSASSPAISPDGEQIAFLTSDLHANKSWVAVIPFVGGEPTASIDLPSGFSGSSGLQWTPDGHGIYCVRTINGVSNIWRLSLQGGAIKQITGFVNDEISGFAWSHDGKKLALARGGLVGDVVLLTNFD